MPCEALSLTRAFLSAAFDQCLNGEAAISEKPVVGGAMFGYMFDIFAWGVVVSIFAMFLAFLAEGRGSHAVRVMLGSTSRKEGLDVFTTLARDDGDWELLGRLSDMDRTIANSAQSTSLGDRR